MSGRFYVFISCVEGWLKKLYYTDKDWVEIFVDNYSFPTFTNWRVDTEKEATDNFDENVFFFAENIQYWKADSIDKKSSKKIKFKKFLQNVSGSSMTFCIEKVSLWIKNQTLILFMQMKARRSIYCKFKNSWIQNSTSIVFVKNNTVSTPWSKYLIDAYRI